jgi:uncharacterized protein YoxC
LQGRTNKLTRTLDETKSELTGFEKDVNGQIKNVSSSINQTNDRITAEVKTLTEKGEELSSSITQTAEAIKSKVSKGNVVSEINQSAESVKIKAEKISLEGIITNNSGFEVNELGSVKMLDADLAGVFTQTDKNGLKSIEIKENTVNFHDWNSIGELVGSIFTGKNVNTGDVGIVIGVLSGNDITFSVKGSDNVFKPVMQINGETWETEPPWIRNTANGTLFPKNSGGGITIKNGLITDWNLSTATGTISIGGVNIVVENGLIKTWY